VLDKAMDTPLVVANLAAIRAKEQHTSLAAIGNAAVHLLGYRRLGHAWNERPDNFLNAPTQQGS
jgi:hypothetical protein